MHITAWEICFFRAIRYSLTGLGPIAQLARAPRLHRGCRGFESLWAHRDELERQASLLASESEETARNTKCCEHNEKPERYENRSGFRNSEGDEIVCNPARDY